MDSFESLGLSEPLARALSSFGFARPTPVQAAIVPLLLGRRDVFVESETGTGKTFGYLAPAYQVLLSGIGSPRRSGEPGILVAAPTQELAVQIGREADRLSAAAGLSLRVLVILGGTPLDKQAAKLREKPDIVVGTPGRLADLASVGKLRLSSLRFLVFDEADRLFAPEAAELSSALLKSSPDDCARAFVSATLPERFRKALRPLLRNVVEPRIEGDAVLSGNIEHWCFYCDGRKRLDFLRKFESSIRPERCLVFVSAASRVEGIAERLASIKLPVAAIHGGMDKEERRVALERFASGEIRYLITSDLGARGLDIAAVSHVLSLDLPEEPTIYTHRAGRTGRAGAAGLSVVLADGVELARASKIAVRGGFVFRCKALERGSVLEPTPEDFFALAHAAEDEKHAARAARAFDGERREPTRFKRAPAADGHREPRGGSGDTRRPSGDARRPSGDARRPASDARPGTRGHSREKGESQFPMRPKAPREANRTPRAPRGGAKRPS